MLSTPKRSWLAVAVLALPLLAGPLADPLAGQQPARPLDSSPLPTDLRVPLHEAPRDPQSPDGSLWAGGATYKVAFDDGYTFYPVLGSGAPKSLPLSWRTSSVTVGGEPIAELGRRTRRHSAWRYELVAGGLVEAYDVTAEGVEQTFVLTERPRGRGDLVVVGRIESELRGEDRPASHGAVEFRAPDGRAAVTYGAALVFDAAGRRLPVDSAVDGATITMTVPAAWLADAVYPVTLDPLTFAQTLVSAPGNTATSSIAIGTEAESGSANVMVVFSRAVSATDHDIYAMLMDSDFNNRRTIYSDLTAVNSDFDAQVAYVAGADRWLVGMQRDYSSRSGTVGSTIRVYYHDRGNLAMNSGVAFSIPSIGQHAYTRPALGGTRSGTGEWGILVYQLDLTRTNTPNSETVVVPIRATTAQFWSAYVAGNNPVGTTLDREDPTVTPVSDGGTDGWLVGWSEVSRTGLTDDWDVHAVRTDEVGARVGSSALLASAGSRHSLRPRLAGSSGTYVLVHEQTESLVGGLATAILARRIDWTVRTGTPGIGPARTVASIAPSLLGYLALESLTYDSRTRSHWSLTYTRPRSGNPLPTREALIARLGGTGGETETATLSTSSTRSVGPTSVAYDDRQAGFTAVYTVLASSAPYHPVYGVHFYYPLEARAVNYGVNCGAARISSSPPYVGHTRFAVSLSAAPANTAATLFVSFGPSSIPLDLFGLKGCWLLADPALMLIAAPAATSSRGGASQVLPLPDVPRFAGDLFAQWAYVAPGANPVNVLATDGLRIEVR